MFQQLVMELPLALQLLTTLEHVMLLLLSAMQQVHMKLLMSVGKPQQLEQLL
jgi:hypothetical protein